MLLCNRLSRRRLAAGLVVGALATVASLVAGAHADAAEKALWGPTTLPDGRSAFALYDELGIDTLQLTLRWLATAPERPAAATDPADPAYRWPAEIDEALEQAQPRGIEIALLVTDAPPWANGGRSPIWAPSEPQDLGDFVSAAARRYPAVRRWMIWGEPNRADRFQPSGENRPAAPRAYAPLLDAAYGALKQRSALNRVIGGMTWTSGTVKPPDFLRWLRLPDGRRPRIDWWGHNPFPFRFPKLAEQPLAGGYRDISDTDTLSAELRRAFGRRVPLWLSEYTIQSDRGSAVFATFVSRAAQARYITAGFRLADALGSAVAGLGWLTLLDQPPAAGSANTGLLTHALERKPAFAAMTRAPSERHRPAVSVGRRVARASLRRPGLVVGVTPRAAGTIVVELRRAGKLRARVRVYGRAERRIRARLRSSGAAPGRYSVHVRAPRGATVRRPLRVR